MSTSDIIALVAIVISALVSITVAITSYRSNKLAIHARRSEMAFEKQIEAFREIAEKISGIRKAIIGSQKPYDESSNNAFYSTVEKATLDYVFTHRKYRVYLPSELDKLLNEFGKQAVSYYSDADYTKHDKFIEEFNKREPQVIKLMNKHMEIK
jgi:hypothetical protein